MNLSNWVAIGRMGGQGSFTMTGGVINKDANYNFLVGTDVGSGAATAASLNTQNPAP